MGQQIKIQSSGGMGDAEIENMVREAEANAGADAEKKSLVEARNEADSLIYNTEKTLMEHKAKVPQEDQDTILGNISAVKEAAKEESTSSADLKEKIEALKKSSMKIGEAMYKNSPPDDAPPGGDESQSTTQDKDKEGEKK